MLVRYGRTSTTDRVAELDNQIAKLQAAGFGEIFTELASGVEQWHELDRTLKHVRKGDTLVVTKMNRLARDLRTLHQLVKNLEERDVALRILDFNGETVDTKSTSGRLLLQMFGAFAEFERSMMPKAWPVGTEADGADVRDTRRKSKAVSQKDEQLFARDHRKTSRRPHR
jgi:DNA invertase Pin-like site-specific DNA recombinase